MSRSISESEPEATLPMSPTSAPTPMATSISTYRATVAPHGWTFDTSSSLSLLQSALRAGIVLPSSCRNGSCRECLCALVSGDIRYLIEWPGVSREERAEGWILPCVCTPLSDVVLAAPRGRLQPVTESGAKDLK